MVSLTAVGRHLVDVAAIMVLGLVYVVALTLGTVATALWDRLASVTTQRESPGGPVEEDRQPAQ
jgi:hypothetical protein